MDGHNVISPEDRRSEKYFQMVESIKETDSDWQ